MSSWFLTLLVVAQCSLSSAQLKEVHQYHQDHWIYAQVELDVPPQSCSFASVVIQITDHIILIKFV